MNSYNYKTTEFTQKMLIAVGIILAAISVMLFLYYAIDVVLLFFGAVLLAIFLRGLADLINRKARVPEGAGVLLVSLVLLVILASAIALLAPSVAEQGRHLRDELPKSAQKASDFISQYSLGKALIEQLPSMTDVMAKVEISNVLSR